MIDFDLTLTSDRVRLRPLQFSDVEAMAALTSDPIVWQYFTSDLSDRAQLEAWVQAGVNAIQKRERLAFTVLDAQSGALIGSTSLGNLSAHDSRIEIGWTWVGKPWWGKGINAHVKLLLLRYCFEDCGLMRVELKTDVRNGPARGAMQRIGLVEEGILRSHTLLANGRRRDSIFYGLLRDEWPALKARHPWL